MGIRTETEPKVLPSSLNLPSRSERRNVGQAIVHVITFIFPPLITILAAVVQPGLGRWPPKPEIPGSNPGGRTSS